MKLCQSCNFGSHFARLHPTECECPCKRLPERPSVATKEEWAELNVKEQDINRQLRELDGERR